MAVEELRVFCKIKIKYILSNYVTTTYKYKYTNLLRNKMLYMIKIFTLIYGVTLGVDYEKSSILE